MRNSFRRPPPQNTHTHFFYSGGEGVAEQDVLSIFSVFHFKKKQNKFDLLLEDPRFLKPTLNWFGARFFASSGQVLSWTSKLRLGYV